MKRDILIAFIVTRVVLLIVAVSAMVWLPSMQGEEYRHVSNNLFIDVWHRWDSGFFTKIALIGYGWQTGHRTADATFMPLYPMLIGWPLRFLPNATRADATVVGVAVSNACLLAALFVFDALQQLDNVNPRRRRLAQWLFLLAPAAIFFSAVYTESLFFLLSLTSIYLARRGRWMATGPIGFLAGMTRVVGWVLIFPLVWEAWQQRDRSVARSMARGVIAFVPALAFPIYALSVGLALGDPKALFVITRVEWAQGVGDPLRAVIQYFDGPITWLGWQRSIVDLIFTLVFVVLAISALRVRIGYGLYALALILFPVWAGTLVSMLRYGAVAFPVYLVLAKWIEGHRRRTIGLLAISALLAAFVAARFVTWQWIA
jgi:hypothetical protein